MRRGVLQAIGLTTLRGRLLVLFALFSVGPLLVSNVWGYLETRRHLTNAAHRNVRNVAHVEASRTSLFVRDKLDLVSSVVAGASLLRRLHERLADSEPRAAAARRAQLVALLAAKAARTSSVTRFVLIEPDGTPIGASSGDRRIAGRCARMGRLRARVVGFEYAGNEPSLLVAAPLVEQGKLSAVLCARVRFDIHHDLVRARKRHIIGGLVYLVDSSGRVVCGSDTDLKHAAYGRTIERLLPAPRLREAIASGAKSWVGHYVSVNHHGSASSVEQSVHRGHGHDQDGQVIAAFATVAGLGWRVVVEVPVSRALASLHQLGHRGLWLTGGLVLLLVVAVALMARTVVRPLADLSAATRQLAAGQLGTNVDVPTTRELSDLAASFNQMSAALQDARVTLERRVQQRTAELGDNQRLLEALLDAISPAVLVIDQQGAILRHNAAATRLFGTPLAGRRGADALRLESEQAPPLPDLVARVFALEQPASGQYSLAAADDEPQIVELSAHPVPGQTVVVLVGRDITDDKQLEAQMVHQEKMAAFGLLAAGVAHDIGNPLAAIQSQLQMARRNPRTISSTRALEVVEKEVRRIERMLRDMVAFTRRRREGMRLVCPNHVIEDVRRLIAHDPRARGVEITLSTYSTRPVKAEEDQIVQVLLNLTINSLDAMPDGGELAVSSKDETRGGRDWVTIRVEDSGGGITADIRRVFEPFYTTKQKERGTGLGLFVSRSVVRDLGGELLVERSDGAGTVMTVRLPAAAADSGKPAR